MKIFTSIMLVLFLGSIFISKSQVGSSIDSQLKIVSLKDKVSLLNTKSIRVQSNVDKAHDFELNVLDQIKRDGESIGRTADQIQSLFNSSQLMGLVDSPRMTRLKLSSSDAITLSEKIFSQKDKLAALSANHNLIKKLGADIYQKTRLTTKALAKGRSSQGQIYFASNQTYLMQVILESVDTLMESKVTKMNEADKIVKALKAFKSTFNKMLRGDEKGNGKVQSKEAYRVLISTKQSLSGFIRSVSGLLGKYEQLSLYRSDLDALWTSVAQIEQATGDLMPKISANNNVAIDRFNMIDMLVVLFGALSGISLFLLYRQRVIKNAKLSQEESKSFSVLKRELGSLESGDLTAPLTVTHAHTSEAAKAINVLVKMIRKLIVSTINISARLDKAIDPIDKVLQKQLEVEKSLEGTLDNTERTAEELTKLSKETQGFGNDYKHGHDESVQGLNELMVKGGDLSGSLQQMIQQSKSLTSINENIAHSLSAATAEQDNSEPLLETINAEIINCKVSMELMDSESKEAIEESISLINDSMDSLRSQFEEVRRNINTITTQTTEAADQMEPFRNLIADISTINKEIGDLNKSQSSSLELLNNSSENILKNVDALSKIANTSLTQVSSVKEIAATSTAATSSLGGELGEINSLVKTLRKLVTDYKV